jgi:hypothetical protein
LWYAREEFAESQPAADFERSVQTRVTLWDAKQEHGILIGKVNYKGAFQAPFSETEIADLRKGRSWLTLTVGNWLTKPQKDDPRLSVEDLAREEGEARPVRLETPRYYYGRLLLEGGGVPFSYPGAEIHVDFPFAGRARIDNEGYFRVHFSEGQYEQAQERDGRKNIYIPNPDEPNTSTARFAFPASKLSRDKSKAGVVKISMPRATAK